MIDWYLRAQSVPRKHSPHRYTTGTSLDCWHKAGRVRGFMLLAQNSDPTVCMPQQKFAIHQTRLHFSSFVQFFWACAHCNLSCFWLTKVEPGVVFCCCSPSASWFEILCILIGFSAHHNCRVVTWPWPFCQLKPALPFSVDLSHQHGVSICRTAAYWMFSVFRTILSKTRENLRRAAVKEMLKAAHLGPTIKPQ